MSLAKRVRRLLEEGSLNLPFPGSGHTNRRHWELAQIARDNLEIGRLVEAHTDALAILHEAGREPKPRSVLWQSGLQKGKQGLKMSDTCFIAGRRHFVRARDSSTALW